MGIIIGAVLGCLLVLSLVALLICYLMKRRNEVAYHEKEQEMVKQETQ